MSYIEGGTADDMLKELLLHISENDGSDERRRLATITYEIEAEINMEERSNIQVRIPRILKSLLKG